MTASRVTIFVIFAVLGLGAEVAFTATKKFIGDLRSGKPTDRTLPGYSLLWMAPIYGSAALLFPSLYGLAGTWNWFLRALCYGAVILIVELFCGIALKLLIGRNPWHYDSGWHLGGFIRLDYLPFWMFAGLAIEFIFLRL